MLSHAEDSLKVHDMWNDASRETRCLPVAFYELPVEAHAIHFDVKEPCLRAGAVGHDADVAQAAGLNADMAGGELGRGSMIAKTEGVAELMGQDSPVAPGVVNVNKDDRVIAAPLLERRDALVCDPGALAAVSSEQDVRFPPVATMDRENQEAVVLGEEVVPLAEGGQNVGVGNPGAGQVGVNRNCLGLLFDRDTAHEMVSFGPVGG